MLRILFVDSGIGGIAERYAYDIHSTLQNNYICNVRRIHPKLLNREVFRSFRPDVMLVIHGTHTPRAAVEYARNLNATTVLWIVEDPYEIDHHRGEMVEPYHYVFTNERQAVLQYRRPFVYYLPWCCNPRVHRRVESDREYQSDLCFVGMGFPNRLTIMNELVERLPMLKYRLIGDWSQWGELHPTLKTAVQPTMANYWEIQRYYNGAKINLNIHRDPADPPSGNMLNIGATSPNDRLFALAGCGAFQIVDSTRPDLWDCFLKDTEVITFGAVNELTEKVRYYLSSPKRQTIAENAQNRAYRDHTYNRRLETIFRIINKPLSPYAVHNNMRKGSLNEKLNYSPVFKRVFHT
ncbi:MAG TPA: glycosyltransferase [Bacillota bacterium]|nr:glycosyltransferase [Bacillota bacterium]